MPGEGSVFRRKSDGRWVAALSVGSRDDRVIYRRYARSKAAARVELAALIAGLRQPAATDNLSDYLVRWVNEARGIRPATRHGYLAVVTNHLVPRIGHIPVGSLTPAHVEALLRDLEPTMRPKTLRNVHVVLRRALGQAMRTGVVSRNVASREYIESPKVPQAEPDALTTSQVRRLLNAVKGDRHEALFVLAIGTGLRQGELLGLAWGDVDFDQGFIHVRQALARRDGAYYLDDPKTDRSKRSVPIGEPVIAALRQHRERIKAEGFVPIASGPVFINTTGGELSGSWLTHHFYQLLERAGIDRKPFKILRATFSSRLAEAGVSDVVIARLMGHARTHTTKRHYIADRPEDAIAAIGRLVG